MPLSKPALFQSAVCTECRSSNGENNFSISYNIAQTRIYNYIISAGICEVKLKNNITKKYTVKYIDPEESVQSYKDSMIETSDLIGDVSPNTKVIFNLITGVDLEDYNTKVRMGLEGEALKKYQEGKTQHPMQKILNQTVIKINREIASFNYDNKVATPWSASLVHKREGKDKYDHHYQYLSDGCHLSSELMTFGPTNSNTVFRNL